MKSARTTAVVIVCLALLALMVARRHRRVDRATSTTEASTRGAPGGVVAREYADQDESHSPNIVGRVRSKSGTPLLGATACAFCAECDTTENGRDPTCEAPDADGRYVIHGLPAGDYQVSLSATDHAPRLANRGAPVHLRDRDVELPDAELEEGGARVSGIVSDATGGPVVGATVQATFDSDDLPVGRSFSQVTKSDVRGGYSLSVPPGHVFLVARADGYADARVGTQAPAQGIRLVVTPASMISGTVLAPDRSPVAGLRVVASGDVGFERVAPSGSDGAFVVTGLRPGTYRLDASGDGWIGRHSGTVTVDILDAARNVVIPVVRAVRVTGTMRVGDGPCRSGAAYLTPGPNAALPQLTAHGGLSGQIVFEAVPPGTYGSAALCDGYGMTQGPEVRVAGASIADLSWSFDRGTDVTVRTVTQAGKAAAGTPITLRPAAGGATSGPGAPKPRSARTNADGMYRFMGVKEGLYVLDGPAVEKPVEVELRATTAATELTVTLKSVGAIDVSVKDARGVGNDQVAVTAAATSGLPGSGGIGIPLGHGKYYIGPFLPGDYHVEVRDGVDPVATVGGGDGVVHVRPDETAEVEVTYGGHSGRITGRVLDGTGMPLENVWVSAEPSGRGATDIANMLTVLTHSTERRSLTNAGGAFVIDGLLETGLFSVVASHALGGEARINGVAVGRDVQLTLATPGRLSGVVLDGNGRPAASFQIVVGNRDSAQHLVPEFGPDSQGKWFVDHVAPGTVEIRAQSPEGVATITRNLAPGQRLEDIELRLQPIPSAQN